MQLVLKRQNSSEVKGPKGYFWKKGFLIRC